MARKILLATLGQIVTPEISRSISAFAEIGAQNSSLPHLLAYPLHYFDTLYKSSFDYLITGNIAKYKKGELTTEEFLEYMKDLYPSSDDDISSIFIVEGHEYFSQFDGFGFGQIILAWNEMCHLTSRAQIKFNKLSDFLRDESDVQMAIASVTNELHFEYVKAQINQGGYHGQHKFLENSKLALSYKEGVLDIKQLATTALKEFDQSEVEIHSFVRDIKSSSDAGLENAKVIYHPYDSNSIWSIPECLHRYCGSEEQDLEL
jgi:hypothetical protein